MENATAEKPKSALYLELKGKKKITLATFKSFINKNRDKLLIRVSSRFDGMTDGTEPTNVKHYSPARPRTGYYEGKETTTPITDKNSLGIAGVWIVGPGRSGDLITVFEEESIISNGKVGAEEEFTTGTICGFDVYNCCGSFRIGIKV